MTEVVAKPLIYDKDVRFRSESNEIYFGWLDNLNLSYYFCGDSITASSLADIHCRCMMAWALFDLNSTRSIEVLRTKQGNSLSLKRSKTKNLSEFRRTAQIFQLKLLPVQA